MFMGQRTSCAAFFYGDFQTHDALRLLDLGLTRKCGGFMSVRFFSTGGFADSIAVFAALNRIGLRSNRRRSTSTVKKNIGLRHPTSQRTFVRSKKQAEGA